MSFDPKGTHIVSQFLFNNEIYVYSTNTNESKVYLWKYDEKEYSATLVATLTVPNGDGHPPVTVGGRVFFGPWGTEYFDLKQK